MRMLMTVTFPNEPFNTAVRNGTAGQTIGKILDAVKPEAIYFTEVDGCRGAIMVLDVPNASAIPGLAEPWFLAFNAKCEIGIAMTPDDLKASNLDSVGKAW